MSVVRSVTANVKTPPASATFDSTELGWPVEVSIHWTRKLAFGVPMSSVAVPVMGGTLLPSTTVRQVWARLSSHRCARPAVRAHLSFLQGSVPCTFWA
jgi:hypothetical protein